MKRSISGIIRSELATIENLQFNGYDLGAILQYLKDKHEMAELSLNTLIVSLYRARKKHLKLGIQTKKIAKEINLNLEIPKKTPKNLNAQNTNDLVQTTIESFQNQSQKETDLALENVQITAQKSEEIIDSKTIDTTHITKQDNQPKLLIRQVRDIFKSKTDISDLI